MAKNTGKVREFCQSGKVGTLIQFVVHVHYLILCPSFGLVTKNKGYEYISCTCLHKTYV